jgi:uncharacterized protein (DUF362 family)
MSNSIFDTIHNHGLTRRGFLGGASLGALGLASGAAGTRPASADDVPGEARVSFVTGTDRRGMVAQALKPFEREIREGIRDRQVVIKTNFVWHGTPLCATHPDAVRGLLEFLAPLYKKKILLAESSASPQGIGELMEGYGYAPLKKDFNIEYLELNEQPTVPFFILGKNLYPQKIQLISTYLDPKNYFISITRPKAHNVVVATLGLKNMVMGSPLKEFKGVSYKSMMHGPDNNVSPWYLNYNMFLVAQRVRPRFTVIDGLEGMEGNGPIEGTPVDHGFALAGPDVIAVDRIGAELMGVDIADIGYLNFCGNAGFGQLDRKKIKILGSDDPAKHVIKYRMNDNIEWQLKWKKDMVVQG